MRYLGIPVRLLLGTVALVVLFFDGLLDPKWWWLSKDQMYGVIQWIWFGERRYY